MYRISNHGNGHSLSQPPANNGYYCFYAPPWRSILFSSCPFATEVIVSVRNGSQLTGVPWDLCLAGHTSATHTFLVFAIVSPLQAGIGDLESMQPIDCTDIEWSRHKAKRIFMFHRNGFSLIQCARVIDGKSMEKNRFYRNNRGKTLQPLRSLQTDFDRTWR